MRHLFLLLLLAVSTCYGQQLKPLGTYLVNPKISKTAKDFYSKLPVYRKDEQKYYNDPAIETMTKAIYDSVFTTSKQNRPFYLYLMNRNMDLMDGALMLSSLMAQYKLIENKPAYFFQYMKDNPEEKKTYFSKWVTTMRDFSGQYCEFNHKDPGTCISNLAASVKEKMAKEPEDMKTLAALFFEQMQEGGPVNKLTTITPGDNGKTIKLTVGQSFMALLHECRGCASVWKIKEMDKKKISLDKEDFLNPSCTNCAGGNHDHAYYFTAKEKGSSQLSFTYFDEKVTVTIAVE